MTVPRSGRPRQTPEGPHTGGARFSGIRLITERAEPCSSVYYFDGALPQRGRLSGRNIVITTRRPEFPLPLLWPSDDIAETMTADRSQHWRRAASGCSGPAGPRCAR
jgi:hypothetical protein